MNLDLWNEGARRAYLDYRHYRQTGDQGALRRAIAGLRAAAEDPRTADGLRADYQSVLGIALNSEHIRTNRPADLDEAISLQALASKAAPVGSPDRLTRLQNLVDCLGTRWSLTHTLADLDWVISVTKTIYTEAPHGHPGRVETLARLGQQLMDRFGQTGDVSDISQAVSALSDAVAASPAGDPNRLQRLMFLHGAHAMRWQATHDLADLDQSIAVIQTVITDAPADHPARAGTLVVLGDALMVKFGETNAEGDINAAISVLSDAVSATPVGHPDRLRSLPRLSDAWVTRWRLTRGLADLDQAIARSRAAAAEAPGGHPARPGLHADLGRQLMDRYQQLNTMTDLNEAISALSEAASAVPIGHPDRQRMLDQYAAALAGRFWRTRLQADVEAAITALRAALDAAPPGHERRPQQLANLGAALEGKYWLTGDPRDIDESLDLLSQALATVPDGHHDRPNMLNSRSVSLLARHRNMGEMKDLDEAVATSRAAVAITPTDVRRAAHLSVLSSGLISRYLEAGRQAPDLADAIVALREAVALSPADHVDRPRLQSNLAGILISSGETPDEAISLVSDAVAATPPGDATIADRRLILATALEAQYDRTGSQDDLDQAIAIRQQVVEGEISVLNTRIWAMSSLATSLVKRYNRTEDTDDLDAAISALRAALDVIPADHPGQVDPLVQLGLMLLARHQVTGTVADRDEALRLLRAGAITTTASPGVRMAAARGWWTVAALVAEPGETLAAFSLAVELLPMAAWHGLDQATREEQLRQWSGLACEAAALAVTARQPERAVELLEAGRSVLWTQALNLRQDTALIRQRAPELAALLDSARAILNAPDAADPVMGTLAPVGTTAVATQGPAAEQRALDRRRQAAHDWDTAVKDIRQLPGLKNFLRSTPLLELRSAASDGPVAIINISNQGSHALIITPPGDPVAAPVLVVDLPKADMDTVASKANTLLNAIARREGRGTDWLQAEQDRHAVFSILEWTWDAVAEPVLAALGWIRPAQGPLESWPRLWWCPTGPATMLPLHAAGIFPRSQSQYQAMGEATATATSVTARVVSSYCTTLSSLARSRSGTREEPGVPTRMAQLAVGVPAAPSYAPGASALPAIPAEFAVLGGYLPAPGRATHLVSPGATTAEVMAMLPRHSWLHLSCHAFQHPTDATRSAFLLDDKSLTLADLVALDLTATDLAYLAACQTALGDFRLLDESLHLAAALQLIGYRHVLATRWSISDAAAPAMAEVIYADLTGAGHENRGTGGEPSAARAPYALHQAATRLRQAIPAEPLVWAPYIHLGP